MMYKLTDEQADFIRGAEIAPNWNYNPVQDINGDWFISETEVESSSIEWMQELQSSEFVSQVFEMP